MTPEYVSLLALSGDFYVKSKRTQRRFRRVLWANLTAAVRDLAPSATVLRGPTTGRVLLEADSVEELRAAAPASADVFGIANVMLARRTRIASLDDLVEQVTESAHERVTGRTFSVRVRRRGAHEWRSKEAEIRIGALLLDASSGVNLDQPEVEVRVEVYGETAYLVEQSWKGIAGIPLGTQERVLALLSGGFDSPVAAWMLMRRGSPVDFLHFELECSQTDQALSVAYDLARRWSAGSPPRAWVVDFSEVGERLERDVDGPLRQVVLKRLMIRAAEAIARQADLPALVTGESVGQVSSQTIANLVAIDEGSTYTILRPLAGLTKEEIIDRSKRIGTHDLSLQAQEVCQLTTGPVDVAVKVSKLERAMEVLPEDLLQRAVSEARILPVSEWMPGWSAATRPQPQPAPDIEAEAQPRASASTSGG